MGNKNVPESTGSRISPESGVSAKIFCNVGNRETGTQELQKICQFLEQICEEQHTVFVHGRGNGKSRNQKYLELFRRFLKRQTYEKWKKRSFKQDISKRENIGYDEGADIYTCHTGKKLRPIFLKKQKARADMNRKSPSMNVKTALTVLIKKNVRKQRRINGCIFRRAF